MIYEIMQSIRNFFEAEAPKSGVYIVRDGNIETMSLQDGQYFRIQGSVFNDGVYKYPCTDLRDETFNGAITPLKVPPAFLDLVEEITAYQAKSGEPSPYVSESFGGYSYTKATNGKGGLSGWQDAFSTRLNAYRKI